MATYIVWSLTKLVNAICDRLLNKFDVVIAIEGRRGLGKSSLAFHLARRIKREMRKRGLRKIYGFKPERDLLYERKEVLRFFHDRHRIGIADEMINVTFNRDFYNEEQKDLIKMINMNRDHHNLFLSCVPQFKNLDSQIKNLCCMKISVIRRGTAIIHTPNKTIYARDIWDEAVNEKIERDWLKGGVRNPKYVRLTTFRGFLKFPKLSDKAEKIYQEIKDRKRNVIAQEKGLLDTENKDPFELIYEMLVNKQIKNTHILEGMGIAHGFKPESLKAKLRNRLKNDNKISSLVSYYYDEKEAKEKEKKKRKMGELSSIIQQVKNEMQGVEED